MSSASTDSRRHRGAWLSNAAWLGFANLLSIAASAIVGLVLIRALGATELGRYSLATAMAVLGGSLIAFRLDQHLLTRIGGAEPDVEAVAVAVRAAYFLYAPFAGLAIVAVALLFRGSDRNVGMLAILEVGLVPLSFSRVVLLVRMRQRTAMICTAASRSAWLLGVGALVAVGAPTVESVIAIRIVTTVIDVVCVQKAVGFGPAAMLRVRTGWRAPLAELKASLPLAGSGIAGELTGRVDQPMLAGLRGATELGMYAAAVRLADIAGVLGPIAQSVVSPGLVDSGQDAESTEFRSILRDGLVMTLVPSALLVAIAAGHSEWLVEHLAGARFRDSADLLVLLALSEWLTFIGSAYGTALLAVGRRRTIAAASAAALVVNAIGNVLLIPRYGAVAAAWMTLAGCAAATAVAGLGAPEVRAAARSSLDIVIKSAIAVAGAALVTHRLRSTGFTALMLGAATYCILTILPLRNDALRVASAFRRRFAR